MSRLFSFPFFTSMSYEENRIMGLWKFSDRVPHSELEEVAALWAREDSNYKQLYIRRVSKDQIGIGFTYEIPEGADRKKTHDVYASDTTDYLKRRFGNDFVGWDHAVPVRIIK